MALPNDRNSREFLSFLLDTDGNLALRVNIIAGGVGTIDPYLSLNDRWYQSFGLDGSGNPVLRVALGTGGGAPAKFACFDANHVLVESATACA